MTTRTATTHQTPRARDAQQIWDELQRVKNDPRIGTREFEKKTHDLWNEARDAGLELDVYAIFKAALELDRRACRRVMVENGWAR